MGEEIAPAGAAVWAFLPSKYLSIVVRLQDNQEQQKFYYISS